MLLPRILSGIVMAILFFCAVFFLKETGFVIFIGIVMMVAAWEWARLSGIKAQPGRIAFAAAVGLLSFGIALLEVQKYVLIITPFLWLLALYWVVTYPTEKSWKSSFVRLLFGLGILLTTWCSLAVLKHSPSFYTYLLILMGLVWGADIGAYCFGRLFGKHKLARYVSPGKSWEGVFGGVLCTQIGIISYCLYLDFSLIKTLIFILVGLATVAVSILGDLTESLLKRNEGIKDSSNLIPGHGGVMDRVDSVTSASPLFVLLLISFGWL